MGQIGVCCLLNASHDDDYVTRSFNDSERCRVSIYDMGDKQNVLCDELRSCKYGVQSVDDLFGPNHGHK